MKIYISASRWDIDYKDAKNPLTSIEQLEELSTSDDYRVRLEVMKNPTTPLESALQMAEKETDVDMLYSISNLERFPIDFRRKFRKQFERAWEHRENERHSALISRFADGYSD